MFAFWQGSGRDGAHTEPVTIGVRRQRSSFGAKLKNVK
jgi:hypothetical protein